MDSFENLGKVWNQNIKAFGTDETTLALLGIYDKLHYLHTEKLKRL